jgi:hypothetical protein
MSSLGYFIDCMTLVSIQPITEMSIMDIHQDGKGGQCVSLTTLTPSRAACLEILRASKFWSIQGPFKPVMEQ